MASNINPSLTPVNSLTNFKFWCQKVLPLVYDDSLSYYEVLGKMVVQLNDVIGNVNADTENVLTLKDAFLELQTYVNNFFDDIDQLASYAERAEAAQTAANTSAVNAASSASNASASSLAAMDARDTAVVARQAAQTSANNASTAATNANTKANEAAQSAITAQTAQASASQSATLAATDRSAAQTAASTATTKANEANTSATNAETSAENAAQSEANTEDLVNNIRENLDNIQQNTQDINELKEFLNGNISRSNLSNTYQSDQVNVLSSTDDLNNCVVPNVYRAQAGTLNAPTSNLSYHVIVFTSKWQNNTRTAMTQIAVSSVANADNVFYVRTGTINSGITNWQNSGKWTKINFDPTQIPSNSITRDMLSNFYEGQIATLTSGSDLNDITTACNVLCNAEVAHTPNTSLRWIIISKTIPWATTPNTRYNMLQTAYNVSNPSEQFTRIYDSSTGFKEWSPTTNNGLSGKKIVLMGDSTYSITGDDGKRIANYLAYLGGCTVYDCSFGGTRMSDSRDASGSDTYMYFDLPRLVDAIIAEDFTDQDANVSDKGSIYAANLATLKTVDFSSIDYLCLEFGANDFTGSVPLGDGTISKTTYSGALAYCVDALMTEYPNLTIVCESPRYRAWLNESNVFVDDVFTHTNSLSLTTQDYVDSLEETSAQFGLPFNNNLNHYGWNKYNLSIYFPSNSSSHFNATGTKYAAKVLFEKLCSIGKSQSL